MLRVCKPELMDDPALNAVDHERALRGLARLNRWSRYDAGIWRTLRSEAQVVAPKTLRVLDLATGSGDLPIRVAVRAKSAKMSLEISACDISPTAIRLARKNASEQNVDVHFFECDLFQNPLANDYDVVMTSLFLHHLAEPQAVSLLQKMADVTERLVLVNDLCRSRINYGLVTLGSYVLGRSYVVRHDGPASIRAAFSRTEALKLAQGAGLRGASVVSQFPCRWLLQWRKPR